MSKSVLYMSTAPRSSSRTRGKPPAPQSEWVHYTPDPATAMRGAKDAAGEEDVLFEHLGAGHTELELTRVLDAPGVTHLRYRVAS